MTAMAEATAEGDEPVLTPTMALVTSLAAFPEELERTLADRSPEALTRPGRDGGWGVIENLCHLRDWEAVLLERVRAVIDGEHPALPAYDDELWAIERDYRGDDPRRVLATFRQHRTALVRLLTGLSAEAWARYGRHEVHGDVTVTWLIKHALEHDDEHLAQIREVLA